MGDSVLYWYQCKNVPDLKIDSKKRNGTCPLKKLYMRAYSFETDKSFVRKVVIRDGMVMFHRTLDKKSPSMNHDITGGLLTLRILIVRRAPVMSMFIEGLPLLQKWWLWSKTLIQNEFGDVIKSLSLYDVISYSRPNKHRHPEIRMIRIVGPPPGPAGDY